MDHRGSESCPQAGCNFVSAAAVDPAMKDYETGDD